MADKKEEKQKKSSVMTVLKLIIILILLIAVVYTGYTFKDNEKKSANENDDKIKEEQTTSQSTTFDKNRIQIKTENDELGNSVQVIYVDSKKIELDLENVVSIDDVQIMDNLALFNVYLVDGAFLYVLDINGNVVDRFVGSSSASQFSGISLSGESYRGDYEIKDNKIYIPSDNFGQDLPYSVCTSSDGMITSYVDVYEYQDGNLVKYETQNGNTKEEVIEEENIDCGEILN